MHVSVKNTGAWTAARLLTDVYIRIRTLLRQTGADKSLDAAIIGAREFVRRRNSFYYVQSFCRPSHTEQI